MIPSFIVIFELLSNKMKQTSKDKIINESLADKLMLARDLKREEKYSEAIEAYHKVLFLKEDPQFMLELA
jgi:predicted glycosyltransferase